MKKQVKTIAIFNHKGGVSKTTTTFNLGWILAEHGKRVIMVDADPQCNLTGLILGYNKTELEDFYKKPGVNNLRAGLAPAFESQPRLIEAVDCIEVAGREGLFLLPGHINLAEYEITLGISQQLSGTIVTVRNLPGAANYLFEKTAKKYKADYLIIDMSPSVSSINQNLLMTSDYFIVPTAPDYFSVMAIDSLRSIIPRWNHWSVQAQSMDVFTEATYPYPKKTPKFLGTIVQNYRLRAGKASSAFQSWINEINKSVNNQLIPALASCSMLLPDDKYKEINVQDNYLLTQVSDFNSLIAYSQKEQTPVFALSANQLVSGGKVVERQEASIKAFKAIFDALALKIIKVTS
jgi:cellulose biosynthesis protein BcsQ